MDTHEKQLWDQIFTQKDRLTQRNAIVAYIRYMSDKAKRLPSEQLTARQDIAIGISSSIAQQEWVDWESEPLLEAIIGVALQLETHDNEVGWDELFNLAAKLE